VLFFRYFANPLYQISALLYSFEFKLEWLGKS